MGPLTDIRVVDCSQGIAGPMAAMYLGDFGAEIVKVEPPGGDPGRSHPGFHVWNRNKRGVVLDMFDLSDASRLRRLLAGADVCVFSDSIPILEKCGFDPDSAGRLNPSSIYLHMPPFLPDSLLPESVQLLAAETGVSASQYSLEDRPVDTVLNHLLYGQAIWGACAATAALVERSDSGLGQRVTVAGVHGWAVTMTGSITRRPNAKVPHPPGGPGGPVPFYRLYECSDGGWLFLAGLTPAFHTAAFAALGVLDELLSDPRLQGDLLASALPENAPWVIERVAAAFQTKPRDQWLEVIRNAGCPCGPVLDRETWFDHEQVRAMGMRVRLDDGERGAIDSPGLPLSLMASPGEIRCPAPTRLGDQKSLPHWEPLPRPPAVPSMQRGTLEGIKVLDLGSIIAGTYAASLLSALGADVVKVESLTGDNLRNFGPTFFGFNIGKRSLALDLRSEDGHAAFLRLVAQSDIVVDNFRPGVLTRLGIDYEALSKVNPRIITVSVTGYGEVGPLGMEPGFDPLLQAASGMMKAQGGDDDPVFFLLPVNDVASAATAALGAVLALFHRKRTDRGQKVTTSLAAQSVMMQSGEVVRFKDRPPAPTGGRDYLGPGPLNRLYRAADGWIRLWAEGEEPGRVIKALGGTPKLNSTPDEVSRLLTAILESLTQEEALSRLHRATLVASPVRTLAEASECEQFVEQGVIRLMTLADRSLVHAVGSFAGFSRTATPPGAFVPGLGEHTLEVLRSYSFAEDEIGRLLAKGVIAQGSVFSMP